MQRLAEQRREVPLACGIASLVVEQETELSIRSKIKSHRFVDQYLSTTAGPDIIVERFSELKGGYSIMAIYESEEAHKHVLRVLLDAAINPPVDILLRADNCTSIARFRQLIKKPGLMKRLSKKFGLDDDQYEDLLIGQITPVILT